MLLKADKSNAAPEVDELLSELGNTTAAIPYFGLFQPGEAPIHFDGVYLTPESFLDQLGADELTQAWATQNKSMVENQQKVAPQRLSQRPGATAN